MTDWRSLYTPMVRKLDAWDISPRARAIGREIAALSFAEGQPEVELWQRELIALTGYNEQCVSKAVSELLAQGVLQRRGHRGDGPRIYRLLPNAEMIEPERIIDDAAARIVRAAVLARQSARRAGDDAGGQAVLLRTAEEQLAEDLADGSAERALEAAANEIRTWTPGQVAEMARRSMAQAIDLQRSQVLEPTCRQGKYEDLPHGQVEALGPSRAGGPAPETFDTSETYKHQTSETYETVAVAKKADAKRDLLPANDPQVLYALELVRKAASANPKDERDFENWLRKWRTRCRAEARLVTMFASEELANQRVGQGADSATRWIFRAAQKAAKEFGRVLKLI